MTLKITYRNGRVETHIGVEKIEKVGEDIVVETFLRVFRLEHHSSGVAKMELFFEVINR